MSNTFCALPFQHLVFAAEGVARMCCMAGEPVTEHGAPMSLHVHSMEEIWNSSYMRNVRKAMLKGERLSACTACYDSEAISGHSYRTLVGLQAIPGEPLTQAEAKKWVGPAYKLDKHPAFFKMELGNVCNVKCRMCSSANSSEIERDPVHNKWSDDSDPMHALWYGDAARIGPEPRIGVRASGFHPFEVIENQVCRWTDGHATLSIPLQPDLRLSALEIGFHGSGALGQHYSIIVNGREVSQGSLQQADVPVTIDLAPFAGAAELVLEIVSNRVVITAGEAERGVPVSTVLLRRHALPGAAGISRPQLVVKRSSADKPWYMDDEKIFGELLKPTDQVKRLNLTGGETFISKRLYEIMDFLIESGSTHVYLELPTNCTTIDDKILDRLKRFRYVDMVLSLDGVGKTYEYIRFPARWPTVEANIMKIKEAGLACVAAPTVQIYNVWQLPELYRFCDALGIRVVENILHHPSRLSISTLPPKTRKAVASRLLAYCETECHGERKSSRLSLAHYIGDLSTPPNTSLINEFMLFTNDLDVSRGQSFHDNYPELVQLLEEEGFPWSNAVVHATGDNTARMSARERVYAWL